MSRPRKPAKRPPGRPPKHGSRALARFIATNKLDRRTRPAKAREKVIALIAADWGGLEEMTNTARLLADEGAVLAVQLMMRASRRLSGEDTADKGTVQLHNALTRTLRTLEDLRREHGRREKTVTLKDYLRAREANGNGHQSADQSARHTQTPTGAPERADGAVSASE